MGYNLTWFKEVYDITEGEDSWIVYDKQGEFIAAFAKDYDARMFANAKVCFDSCYMEHCSENAPYDERYFHCLVEAQSALE